MQEPGSWQSEDKAVEDTYLGSREVRKLGRPVWSTLKRVLETTRSPALLAYSASTEPAELMRSYYALTFGLVKVQNRV